MDDILETQQPIIALPNFQLGVKFDPLNPQYELQIDLSRVLYLGAT